MSQEPNIVTMNFKKALMTNNPPPKNKSEIVRLGSIQARANITVQAANMTITKHSKRSAIIPYTVVGKSLHIQLGIHKKSGELTDLGGGVKKDENDLSAAVRELHEESRNVYKDMINTENSGQYISISKNFTATRNYNLNDYATGEMTVIFVPVKKEMYNKTNAIFQNTMAIDECQDEISKLVWLSESTFMKAVDGSKSCGYVMWPKLKKFYKDTLTADIREKLYSQFEEFEKVSN